MNREFHYFKFMHEESNPADVLLNFCIFVKPLRDSEQQNMEAAFIS
jgi:hypothetical protein